MGTYKKIRRFSSDVHVYTYDPSVERFDATIGKRGKLEKLSTIEGEPKSDEIVVAKINGGFFAMNGSTEYLGSFVDEGLYYQGASQFYPTLIYWKKDNRLTIENNPNQSRHAVFQKEAWWAMGVPWTLVIDSKQNFQYDKNTLITVFGHPYQRAPRTLIGQKADGTIVWVVVDGRKVSTLGITCEQSASIMLELGCVIAVNVDGGGSSEMIVDSAIKNKPSDGVERAIGTAFVAYAKKSSVSNPYSKPTTTLRQGSSGNAVRWLQWELKIRGFYTSLVDGSFGAGTKKSVIEFQKSIWPSDSKQWDGCVGPATRSALQGTVKDTVVTTPTTSNTPTVNPYPVPTRTLNLNKKGEDVKWLQWELNNRGFNSGAIDGSFGSTTRMAVVAYQKSVWPSDPTQWDGIVGLATREKLLNK